MNNLIIKSLNYKILIQTNSSRAKEYFLTNVTPCVFIPGYSVSEIGDTPQNIDITIKHENTVKQEIYINFEKNKYLIFDNWNEKVPTYILSFIQSCFNNLSLRDSRYTIHSSAVQGKNYNFLLTGRAGAGKTSTMLELVTKYGFKYISNNKTIVEINDNQLSVLAGTMGVTLRDKNLFNKIVDKAKNNHTEMYGRIGFIFKDEYRSKTDSKRKTAIFAIRINPGVEEFRVLSNEEATIFLYPFLLESVDREVLLFNWTQPVPLNGMEYERKSLALKDLQNVLKNTKVYHLSGSMDFMCGKIVDIERINK